VKAFLGLDQIILKELAKGKRSNLFIDTASDEEKSFVTFTPRVVSSNQQNANHDFFWTKLSIVVWQGCKDTFILY
jgi:hypothetical protein